MTIWYSLEGTVNVRADEKVVADIVERFSDLGGNELFADYRESDDESFIVQFIGGWFVNANHVERFDNIAKELAPFVTEHAFLNWVLNDDRGVLYIGDPDYEAAATSQHFREKIEREFLDKLLLEDCRLLAESLKRRELDCSKESTGNPLQQQT
jgi:hypothetical protein